MPLSKDFQGQIFKELYLRMGGPIDIKQMGWEYVSHDHNRDHLVTKFGYDDLPDSHRGDFICRRPVDSSS